MIHLNTYQSLTLYESLDNLSPIKTVCIIRQMYTLKLITKDIQVMHQIQVSFHQFTTYWTATNSCYRKYKVFSISGSKTAFKDWLNPSSDLYDVFQHLLVPLGGPLAAVFGRKYLQMLKGKEQYNIFTPISNDISL